ncbi:hypothetical protein ACFRR7_01795 [Streptomyces sp. NPDC056909]|uniref:hypothetical protein n=1 Tax=unclassified Streptomyces TaxID=2593676 RepID=UPI003428E3BC|nr:hypothetical protein OG214_14145 [Streptomyces sp. NBC_00872]
MRGPLGAAGREHGHALPVTERKQVLLRLDPAVYDALARWASDELRSANAQIEFLLRRSLADAGRLPGNAAPIPRRGRPPKATPPPSPPGQGG